MYPMYLDLSTGWPSRTWVGLTSIWDAVLPKQDGGTSQINVNPTQSARRCVTLYIGSESEIPKALWGLKGILEKRDNNNCFEQITYPKVSLFRPGVMHYRLFLPLGRVVTKMHMHILILILVSRDTICARVGFLKLSLVKKLRFLGHLWTDL